MANKCENCTEKCPQAERAHNAALGRMYATNEFISLLKKVESGELVEVVRCKDCKSKIHDKASNEDWCNNTGGLCCRLKDDYFCPFGERREGE